MQETITNFTTLMTWLVLLLCLVVVVLLGWAAWLLPQDRSRALLGVVVMVLVVGATGISLVLLSQKGHSWARLLLPLATPLLLFSLYRLCFPPLDPVPVANLGDRHHLLLLLLTLGTLITIAGFVLLDLFFL